MIWVGNPNSSDDDDDEDEDEDGEGEFLNEECGNLHAGNKMWTPGNHITFAQFHNYS